MTQITGKIYQQTNAAGTENRFPRTVMEAVLGLNSYLQAQFGALADIYMPIEGINQAKPNQEFVYRQTPNTIKAKALTLDKIKGKTLAWNQNYKDSYMERSDSGYSYDSSTHIATYISTGTNIGYYPSQPWIKGHKYYVSFYVKASQTSVDAYFSVFGDAITFRKDGFTTTWEHYAGISVSGSDYLYMVWRLGNTESGVTYYATRPVVIDLTLMFGAGNEPSTVEEFEALFPLPYYEYNEGTLISNDAESLETVGFNKWDEEWEVGSYNYTNGEKINESNYYRSKNFIEVFPNTDYYWGQNGATYKRICFYDSNKNFISYTNGITNVVFTTPNQCKYITIWQNIDYINHDICINIFDPAKNGQYEPYRKSVLHLNLNDFWVKDGQGILVHITGGLKSAGSVYDEIVGNKYVKRVDVVDLGTLNYMRNGSGRFSANLQDRRSGHNTMSTLLHVKNQSWDDIPDGGYDTNAGNLTDIYFKNSNYDTADSFKNAVNGVMLYYELATPIEYDLVESLPTSMPAGTTEARISPNADGLSAPFCADMTYGMGATEYAETAGVASFALNAQYAEVAARLLTPRTIWGQVFDGSANITGAMTGVSAIDSLMHFDTSNGRIGIGISTPLYNLDVAGTFHAAGNSVFGGMMYVNDMEVKSIVSKYEYEWDSEINPIQCFEITEDGDASFFNVSVYESVKILGYYNGDHEFGTATLSYVYAPYDTSSIVADKPITAPSFIQSSDQRLKTNLSPIALTVEQIASAPAVEFNWVGNGQRGAGSIAQYWEEQLPYNVHRNGDLLTMEYGNIALISAIVCARKIQELEDKIKELEAKINV